MPENFMARPTDVLVSYLARKYERTEESVRAGMLVGRMSMCLEIITVMRLLEDHEDLVAHSQEAISILQTLLNDQGLAELAHEWYELLGQERRLKLVRDDGEIEPASS